MPSLVDVSRDDLMKFCRKFRDDKLKLRQYLVALFAKRENIALFGWFINQSYNKLETPDFHRQIYSLITDESVSYIAIGAPRGHAKSTVVDFTFALWSACYQRHHFCVIVSDTYTQSVEFVNALKDQFENNVLVRWLYGDLVSDIWRDGEFVLKTNIKFIAMGAGMKIRGIRYREYRPDLLIVDDLENDEQVSRAEQRKKLKSWFTKAALPALAKNGRCIVIGTILHYDSLLNNILEHKEMFTSWSTLLFTAIYADSNGVECALWPEHMSLEYLHDIRDNPKCPKYIGSIAFAQEYQNKPFDEASAIVQPEWIKWADADDVPSSEYIVASAIAIDPAASERQSADPTARIYAELDNQGNLYVRAIGNDRLSPQKVADSVHEWNDVYHPNRIGVEQGVLGLVFRDLLAGLPVIPLKPDKDKTRRLLAVTRFFESGRIHIVKGVKNAQALYDQLIEFPAASHDDMVDALVYVIRMLLVDRQADDKFEVADGYELPAQRDDNGDDAWADDSDDEFSMI